MAGINDYSNTPSLNTTINTIDVDEGCNPANINDAIRQLMADIADVDDGVVPLQTPDINGGTIDGAVIGGTTAAAGTFTTVTATSFSGDGSGLTGISAGIDEVTAGSGLTGGGSSGSVTLNVGAGTGISVAADTVGLATAGPGAGTYGSTDDATKIDTITLDAYGRVTAVATGATGDIAGVTAGTNLTGGGTSGTVTLNLNPNIVLTSIGLGNRVTLSESSDRADLLAVTGTTSTWAGVCIKNTSNEVITSFMAQGTQFGLYDDQQNEWAILCNENAAVELYHNGLKKIETTSSGILVTGGVDMNASWGEVGTYSAMKNHSTASTINPGQTVAGSTLRVANFSGGILGNTFIPTGTWRAMGWAATSNSNNNTAEATLFFRIS